MKPTLLNGLGFVSCIVALGIVFYFQFVKDLLPCELCVFQRVGVIGAGMIMLVALLHRPTGKGVRAYAFLTLIPLVFGLIVALRQVHLQNMLHKTGTACGAGLNYLVQENGIFHGFAIVFRGSGDCSKVHFRLLGLSIAGWSAVFFALMVLLFLYQLCRSLDRG